MSAASFSKTQTFTPTQLKQLFCPSESNPYSIAVLIRGIRPMTRSSGSPVNVSCSDIRIAAKTNAKVAHAVVFSDVIQTMADSGKRPIYDLIYKSYTQRKGRGRRYKFGNGMDHTQGMPMICEYLGKPMIAIAASSASANEPTKRTPKVKKTAKVVKAAKKVESAGKYVTRAEHEALLARQEATDHHLALVTRALATMKA